MPRRSQAEAQQTRTAIIARAVETASVEGLDGVTIGGLAGDLGMSKAGVIGHFGTKTELQHATLERAREIFTEQVWTPAEAEQPGLVRLRAVVANWIDHLADCPFPGGCFMTQASCEWDARQGEMRDDVRSGLSLWRAVLRREARTAVENGELPAEREPDQVAFELMALAMGLNQSLQLFGDRRAAARARKAAERILAPA